MVMTPLELDNRDFKKAVRGYSEEEVEYYISVVRADYETLYTENQQLKVRLDDYELNIGKYKALEHTLNNTLIVAQQTSEELKRNAEKAAELILEEAKLKAQQRIHEAEAEIRKLSLQREDLLKRIIELKVRLRVFLRAQLELLDRTIGEEEDFLPKTSAKAARELGEKQMPQIMKQEPEEMLTSQIIKQETGDQPISPIMKKESEELPTPQIIKQELDEQPMSQAAKQESITPEPQTPQILRKEPVVHTAVNPFDQASQPYIHEEAANEIHHDGEVATITENPTPYDEQKVVEALLQKQNHEVSEEDEIITAKSLMNKAKKWVQRNKT